ncbi:MAG: ATP-binding protein [Coleofasciculaceae cyanobacterium]
MKDFHQSSKQVKSDLTELEQVLLWFDQLHQPFIPRKVWLQCQLALAEGFTNAIRHAHKGLPTDVPIELEVTLFPQHLELRVWDHGPPFDLEQWFQIHEQKVDSGGGGGRGIAILKKIADQLSYTRTDDNRNCLSIVKYY